MKGELSEEDKTRLQNEIVNLKKKVNEYSTANVKLEQQICQLKDDQESKNMDELAGRDTQIHTLVAQLERQVSRIPLKLYL